MRHISKGCKMLLFAHGNLHRGVQLVQKLVTLNGVICVNSPKFGRHLQASYVAVVEVVPIIVATKIRQRI